MHGDGERLRARPARWRVVASRLAVEGSPPTFDDPALVVGQLDLDLGEAGIG